MFKEDLLKNKVILAGGVVRGGGEGDGSLHEGEVGGERRGRPGGGCEDDHRAAIKLGPTTFSFLAWSTRTRANQTKEARGYFAVLCLCDHATDTEDAFR